MPPTIGAAMRRMTSEPVPVLSMTGSNLTTLPTMVIRPAKYSEQEIHDPDVLLAQYNALQKDIAALRGQLKDILEEALDNSH